MTYHSTLLTSLVLSLSVSSFAIGCGSSPSDDAAPPKQEPESSTDTGKSTQTTSDGQSPITWCNTALNRRGTIAQTNIDYPSEPDTTWFNRALEEVAVEAYENSGTMKEAGLDPKDEADVRRFKYFASGFDLRWIMGDVPSGDNWFSNTDLSVYVFDLVNTGTPANSTVPVFDASAVREARLSGDKKRLGATIRETVDAMMALPVPKAIVAFAPNRVPETSGERFLINLFARDVHFATAGSVSISNLRDNTGAPAAGLPYPLRNVRTLDVSGTATIAGTAISVSGGCLDLRISG